MNSKAKQLPIDDLMAYIDSCLSIIEEIEVPAIKKVLRQLRICLMTVLNCQCKYKSGWDFLRKRKNKFRYLGAGEQFPASFFPSTLQII